MCFGNRQTASTTSGPSQGIQNIGFNIGKQAERLSHQNAPNLQRSIAPISADQNRALAGFRGLTQRQPINAALGQSNSYLRQSAGPASTVGDVSINPVNYNAATIQDPGRVVDQGRLGGLADYMNPYTDNVLGNTIQRLQESADLNRQRLNAGATFSNAFGDARTGIESSLNQRNLNDSITRAADQSYSNAFDRAMVHRTGDLDRMTNIDTRNADILNAARRYAADADTQSQMYNADASRAGDIFNAGQQERQFGRQFQAGTGLVDTAGAAQGLNLETLAAYMGAGSLPREIDQARRDAGFDEKLLNYQHGFNRVGQSAAALSGVPYSTTQTTSRPDNSGFGAIGSLLSAFL